MHADADFAHSRGARLLDHDTRDRDDGMVVVSYTFCGILGKALLTDFSAAS